MRCDRKGSVLLLTLFLVLLAGFAMSRFIEKAYSEILGEALYIERDRARIHAYSALETTVAVLYEIARLDAGLHSPEQGWDDPLDFAGVVFPEGLDVQVEFVDEMGKISLPRADREQLLRLFEVLDFDTADAEELTDALLAWVSREEAEKAISGLRDDYERSELPYRPPYQPLKSFRELAAIRGFDEAFFDEQGVPNERLYQLASLVSLYRFERVNVNAAAPAVLRIWSDLGELEAANIGDHRELVTGPSPFFRSLEEAASQLGVPLSSQFYSVATHCIRINITVTEGGSSFVLSAVVAPGQGAAVNLLPTGGQPQQTRVPPRVRGRRAGGEAQPNRGRAGAPNVPYPFNFLEIRENEAIL